MARTLLATQQTARTGITAAFTAVDAANGMYFQNNGNVVLEVVTTGTATNVTVRIAVAGPDGLVVTDRAVAVGATARMHIGPFPASLFNQPGSIVNVDFSSATGATVAALQLF